MNKIYLTITQEYDVHKRYVSVNFATLSKMVKKLTNFLSVRNYSENNQQTKPSGEKEAMSKSKITPRRQASRVILHPGNTRAFISNHRLTTFTIAASLVTVLVLGIAAAQGFMNQNNGRQNEAAHIKHEEGKSVTTTTTNNPASDKGPQTNVIVNGQPIDVPDNGSVSRTLTDRNGTTHVEISNSSNGSSISSSTVTNNSGTSAKTYSQSLSVTTNNSP